jgi:hypothetical protein
MEILDSVADFFEATSNLLLALRQSAGVVNRKTSIVTDNA